MKNFLLFLIISFCGVYISSVSSSKLPLRTTDFERYWTLDEINDYILELGEKYPDITEVEEMGITHENRTLYGIRIVNNELLAENEFTMPVILITAGSSARDWISVMAAVNIIHELVEHYHEFEELVDRLEWFIVPVLNPDGYEFSRTEGNRAWIKNRRPNEGSNCTGVNIDRNFGHYWDAEINSSADPCSPNYRGTEPASEEESRLLKYFFTIARPVEVGYVSIQATEVRSRFLGAIAYPFSHSNEAIPDNWEQKQMVANDMSGNVNRMTNARYLVGSTSNLNELAAGTATDYASAVAEIPFVYTIFTNPSGRFGWDVEEWRINPTADQVFAAIEDMARHFIIMPA